MLLSPHTMESDLSDYLASFDRLREIKQQINEGDPYPPLYYAIASNRDNFVKIVLDYGADPNWQNANATLIPPLAFAIMHGYHDEISMVVKLLLARGANVDCICRELYYPVEMPKATTLNYTDIFGSRAKKGSSTDAPYSWCSSLRLFLRLRERLNLTLRYFLGRYGKQ